MKKYLVALSLLVLPTVAHAEGPPGRWDRAKDPDKIEDHRLHVSAQRMFGRLDDARQFRSDLYEHYARELIVSLDAWNAAESKDVRLRVDLGQALEDHGEHKRAAEVLKSAIALDPNHPIIPEAWLFLGFACGHIGDHVCERDSYHAILRHETEDRRRVTPLLNLAEVEMHLGNMRESVAGYEETIRVAARLPGDWGVTVALAQWGLAVAMDRMGDRIAADREAKKAVALERSMRQEGIVHGRGIFFYPDYEVLYYDGLGGVARAKEAASAHDAAIFWAFAERKFDGYVKNAEQRNPSDRFLAHAKARLASCRAEREKAEKRRVKEPLKRSDDEELPL